MANAANESIDIDEQEPLRRAVIYLRVSTNSQADTDFDAEGLSIKAQRSECQQRAAELGAVIVQEYIDIGESARSANRQELQRMLDRLEARRDIDFVIVHKIDRLARNRLDDVSISLAIRKAGAILVSCSENIDETPQGRFMHGIMASVAELYSANLSTEALKGLKQKVKLGGTVTIAPLGYLNVIKNFDGRNVRTVEVDADRAHHIRWAFEQYATGDWTLSGLADALEDRGLRTRIASRGKGQPVSRSRLQSLLRSPYYVGIVTFQGVQYPGRHEPLIDTVLFEQVQSMLSQKSLIGERPSKHQHYLKGTVFCGSCGGRLAISHNTGNGGTYGYFFCLNRQQRASCTQPWIAIESIEQAVESYWLTVRPSDERLATVRQQIAHHVGVLRTVSARELTQQSQRLETLERQERKLLEAHYAEAVSLPLLQSEQRRIGKERASATRLLAVTQLQYEDIESEVESLIAEIGNGHRLYLEASSTQRRTMNRSVFERIWITKDGVVAANLSPGFAHIGQPDLDDILAGEFDVIARQHDVETGGARYQRRGPSTSVVDSALDALIASELGFSEMERPYGRLPAEMKNPVAFQRQGSNKVLLVGLTGFEPATPCPPDKCATKLRYSPLLRIHTC
ncbi:MAG: recombinase family protein [Ilumatobacteraceae bacterium]|nr:recombinase family protein [Ilumatobacteraceae bacterium]